MIKHTATSLAIVLSLTGLPAPGVANAADQACGFAAGQWIDGISAEAVTTDSVFEHLHSQSIVLLGEVHDQVDHHRWQLQMLAGLHARHPEMVIGFEMFPRRVQPVLDAWVRGELDETAFLAQSDWQQVWNFDPALYLPLFHFARLNRIPMVALNVERSLIATIAEKGWENTSKAQREGVGEPEPGAETYISYLAGLYAYKNQLQNAESAGTADELQANLEEIRSREDFKRFVKAQLVWDRAMAEALLSAGERRPDAMAVGIVGRGHLEYGHGIPHQLNALGMNDHHVLIPVDQSDACQEAGEDVADHLFVISESVQPPAKPRPLLGVTIEDTNDGVRIIGVSKNSVAEASGLQPGDMFLEAAGFEIQDTRQLIQIIKRTAPGNWLPLQMKRDGSTFEAVARFPTRFTAHP